MKAVRWDLQRSGLLFIRKPESAGEGNGNVGMEGVEKWGRDKDSGYQRRRGEGSHHVWAPRFQELSWVCFFLFFSLNPCTICEKPGLHPCLHIGITWAAFKSYHYWAPNSIHWITVSSGRTHASMGFKNIPGNFTVWPGLRLTLPRNPKPFPTLVFWNIPHSIEEKQPTPGAWRKSQRASLLRLCPRL